MRTLVKTTLARTYAALGGLRRLHAGRMVMLTFHRVRPDGEETIPRPMRNLEVSVSDFRRILTWMRERYAPMALGDWIARGSPPARASFGVTFDDGWADNYENAVPVLQEFGIPATIFLSTGAVEDRTPFWWQQPGLSDAEIETLKHEPPDRLEARAKELRDGESAADFLIWEQIREMGRSGLISFGPHGHRHALMTSLSSAEALEDVQRCWMLLQQHVPEALVPVLAWPNGNARSDLDGDLNTLGLQAAVGTSRGAVATVSAACWNLPRNNVDRNSANHPGLLPWLLMRAR